ncbi:MAG: HNH endonuclease family protein [Actinomycetota bacterium]
MKFLGKKTGWFYLLVPLLILGALLPNDKVPDDPIETPSSASPTPSISALIEPSPAQTPEIKTKAIRALEKLPIKGRAPKTGYSREQFADGWEYSFGCDTRNRILQRDLASFELRAGSSCIVESGVLEDPYTGSTIDFLRGVQTSLEVQIDHVVALSDAWQKGAQKLSSMDRFRLYNDPLNLLAVDGGANSSKGDSDAASWLPSNKAFRCEYVARQIAVKLKYQLWLTAAESSQMKQVLQQCPKQKIPAG